MRSARALSYWTTTQQLDLGLCGIAMALIDRHGECKGAIGMTLQTQSHTPEDMVQRLLPLLREAAQAMRPLL